MTKALQDAAVSECIARESFIYLATLRGASLLQRKESQDRSKEVSYHSFGLLVLWNNKCPYRLSHLSQITIFVVKAS